MSFSHRLSDSLRRALGQEAAEDFVGWRDQVEDRRIEVAEFRETIRGDIAELRQEFHAEMQSLRLDMQRLYHIVLVNSALSLIAIVISLIALLK